jgi:hypothetical protein
MAWSLVSVVAATTPPTTAGSAASDLFGGTTSLLQLFVLALGGALVVGNVLALVRPPTRSVARGQPVAPPRPPLARSLMMITIGMVAVIWALASLTS